MPRISNAHCITHFTLLFSIITRLSLSQRKNTFSSGKLRERQLISSDQEYRDGHAHNKKSEPFHTNFLANKKGIHALLQHRKRMNVIQEKKICSTAAMLSSLSKKKSLRNFITKKRTESSTTANYCSYTFFLIPVRPFIPPLNKGEKTRVIAIARKEADFQFTSLFFSFSNGLFFNRRFSLINTLHLKQPFSIALIFSTCFALKIVSRSLFRYKPEALFSFPYLLQLSA